MTCPSPTELRRYGNPPNPTCTVCKGHGHYYQSGWSQPCECKEVAFRLFVLAKCMKQRDIRFRAWCPKLKAMRGCAGLDLTGWGALVYALPGEGAGLFTDKDCIPMQFTGLKDKNGKEIYEGDIVDRYSSRGGHLICEVGWDKNRVGFWPMVCDRKLKQYEVIGNIYETPELLDAKQ